MVRILRATTPPLLAALLFSASLTSHTRVATRLSWDQDAGRILQARCAGCHTTAPVDLSTYASARPWARAMREAMLEGHGYAAGNGTALTPFERELLVQWIDGGSPERSKFFPDDYSRSPAAFVRISAANPLAALDAHHAARGGTREIIPGLGLALRTADDILVFDRGAGPDERIIARGTVVTSLAAHLAALAPDIARTRVSDAAYIVGPSAEPRYEVAEIAQAGPDRFWCPMHPDVRSASPGTCPRCAMTLVAMPAMSLDTFALDVVRTEPAAHGQRVTIQVTRGTNRTPVTSFLTLHDQPFHLFVIDERLETFEHVHPEVAGDTLVFTAHPHARGNHWLVGDFAPLDAFPQLRMTRLPRPVDNTSADRPPPIVVATLSSAELRAGRESRLTFQVTDPQTRQAPADLEPYLGAAAHLFVIDEQLRDPLHAHPVEIGAAGLAQPAFDVRFPRVGRYVMWLQVQRAGRVETLRFTADVSK